MKEILLYGKKLGMISLREENRPNVTEVVSIFFFLQNKEALNFFFFFLKGAAFTTF